jgi:hypothetical protein
MVVGADPPDADRMQRVTQGLDIIVGNVNL